MFIDKAFNMGEMSWIVSSGKSHYINHPHFTLKISQHEEWLSLIPTMIDIDQSDVLS